MTSPCSGACPGVFLLAAVFACRHQGRNTSQCLLSEEVLLQMTVVQLPSDLCFEKDVLSAVR